MNQAWVKGGVSPNPSGRPKGVKTRQVRLREAQAKAVDTLISAAHRGDVVAAAALINYQTHNQEIR